MLALFQHVDASADGLNLSWDDCGNAGTEQKTFACNVNSGAPFVLVGSFVPPPGVIDYVGLSADILVQSSTPNLPDWWKHGAGQCRGSTGLSVNFDFSSGPFTCLDVTAGAVAGGFLYNIGFGGPDRALLRLQGVMPSDQATALDTTQEVYAFKVQMLRAKTTGAGACAGCNVSTSLTLSSIQLFQLTGGDPVITATLDRNVAIWQGGPPPLLFSIDARELSEPQFRTTGSGGACLSRASVQSIVVTPGPQTFTGCFSGAQFAFAVDAGGIVSYAPALEGLVSGAGTNTLVVHGHPIEVDARPDTGLTFRLFSTVQCSSGDSAQAFRLLPGGAYSISACTGSCPVLLPMAFGVDGSGHVTYDPILEGALSGAGTSTLVVHSFTFLPAGDDNTSSMGIFRVVVEPAFWSLMVGYPGYGVVNGLHRLVSPRLYDPHTVIGRSTVHRDGDAADLGGTAVGTAGTIVSDASFSVMPPGFQGPNGTLEVHTEIRSLNLSDFGVLGVNVRAGTNAPGRPISPGEIEAGPGVSGLFPAESFFDVFVEVDLPTLGTLYNTQPLVVENSGITCFPPRVVYRHRHTGPVPIVFKDDDAMFPQRWHQGDRFGWLVLAGHGYDFDTLGTVASWSGTRGFTDPFAELEEIVNSEPEMADTATIVVDIHDVLTFSDPGAYVQPDYRDSLLAGLDAAAALGRSGDPCAGTQLISMLYARVDGLIPPADWVVDTTVRRVLADRIHALGAQLQAQANQSGGCLPTAVTPAAPTRVAIVGIQPNPSFGATSISYAVPSRGRVTVSVFDLSGRLVRTLVDGEIPAGVHRAEWDGHRDRIGGRPASSGTYFVRLSAGGVTQTKRLILLR